MTSDSGHQERGRVLVADGDDRERGLLTVLLRTHGYEADGVASGEAALALLALHDFDLVLLDAELRPSLDVLDAARRLAPDARFVMLAAFATVDVALAAISHGAHGYLRKPLHADEMMDVVTHASPKLRERIEQASRRGPTTGTAVSAPSSEVRSTPSGRMSPGNEYRGNRD